MAFSSTKFSSIHQQMLSQNEMMYQQQLQEREQQQQQQQQLNTPKALSAIMALDSFSGGSTSQPSAASAGYISPMQLHYQPQQSNQQDQLFQQQQEQQQQNPEFMLTTPPQYLNDFEPMQMTVSPRDAMLKSPQDDYYGKAFNQMPSLFGRDEDSGPQFIYPTEREDTNGWTMEEPEAMDEDDEQELNQTGADEPATGFDDVLFSSDDEDLDEELYDIPPELEHDDDEDDDEDEDDVVDMAVDAQADKDHTIDQVTRTNTLPALLFERKPHQIYPSQQKSYVYPSSSDFRMGTSSSSSPEPEIDDSKDEEYREEPRANASNNATGAKHSKKKAPVSGNGPHQCELTGANGEPCGKVFSRPYDLVRHQDTIHAAVRKTFKCEICGDDSKTFSRMDALSRHVRVKHSKA